MKRTIGITGQQGFIGQHLYNTVGLFPNEFIRINFNRNFFEDAIKLASFVDECDVIVHLAAMNRHDDPEIIYETNIDLTNKLVDALKKSGKTPQVLFSSSSQEERENLYGKSKKDGRELLVKWAREAGATFTGMVIPNVFGPFGKPFYNSFIATFCHQLTHDQQPVVEGDGQVKLIYVAELVDAFLQEIRSEVSHDSLFIRPSGEYKVSEILHALKEYKSQFFLEGIIPKLRNSFQLNLFNTFRSYMDIENHYPVNYIKKTDARGTFVEVIRLNVGGQISFSTTHPGTTHGDHYHTRKIERFSVIKGRALIQLRKIGTIEIINFYLDGENPSYVDMPIWYIHNITNIGEVDLLTHFWINECYDVNDPDTFTETVQIK